MVDDALRAVAEPRRRAIPELVASDELAAGEIAAHFDVTRTAISQHLAVWSSSLDVARRIVEAELGIDDNQGVERAG